MSAKAITAQQIEEAMLRDVGIYSGWECGPCDGGRLIRIDLPYPMLCLSCGGTGAVQKHG